MRPQCDRIDGPLFSFLTRLGKLIFEIFHYATRHIEPSFLTRSFSSNFAEPRAFVMGDNAVAL